MKIECHKIRTIIRRARGQTHNTKSSGKESEKKKAGLQPADFFTALGENLMARRPSGRLNPLNSLYYASNIFSK